MRSESRSKLATLTGLMLRMGFLASPATAAEAPGILTFFLPDSEPTSLDASIVSVVNSTGAMSTPVTFMEIACPTAASPENDACRAAGIYPAQVYHTQGSVWGGTTTYSADDSTTTWRCALGGGDASDRSGNCNKTIVSGGTTRTETVAYDGCGVVAHQLPIVVTAGAEKMDAPSYLTDWDAEGLNAEYRRELAEAKCPASETTMWAGAVASTTGSEPAITSTTQTQTAPGEATSSAPAGNGVGHGVGLPGVVLGVGAITVFGIVL